MDKHDYVGDKPTAPAPKKPAGTPVALRLLKPLASLQLTIVLFALSLILIFFGTIAQKYDSMQTVVDNYFYDWIADLDLNLLSDFTQVFFSFRFDGKTEQDRVKLVVPFFGGFTLGWMMVVNLTAAHIVRFKLSWKRSGIWILHIGMLVLLGGEFVRAKYATEDRMSMYEGEARNYLFSLDKGELAFMTSTDGKTDQVISFPSALIAKSANREPLSHPDLPFKIQVVQFMKNTQESMQIVSDPAGNPATMGMGRYVKLVEAPEVSSIRGGGRINAEGCYVRLLDKTNDRDLGTFLLGYNFDDPEKIVHGEKTYRFAYRLKRTYLPYSLKAMKVERVDWPNSNTPKEYKSTVQLQNQSTNETRDVIIEMNSPLRYAGRTFYQSTMEAQSQGILTGFQVVRNPGSTLPYIACILITIGMAFHFLLKLWSFLEKRTKTSHALAVERAAQPDAPTSRGTFKRDWGIALGVGVFAIALFALAAKPKAKSKDDFDLQSFGQIPVQFNGRPMPLDTFARHSMVVISGGRETFKKNRRDKESLPATAFVLELMANKDEVTEYPVIRIVDLNVIQFLGLERRAGWWRYSYREVRSAIIKKMSDFAKIQEKSKANTPLSDFESSLMGSYRHLREIDQIRNLLEPAIFPDPKNAGEWMSVDAADRTQAPAFINQATATAEVALQQQFKDNPQLINQLVQRHGREGVQDAVAEMKNEAIGEALHELFSKNRPEYAPQAAAFTRIIEAYGANNVEAFNAAVASYHDQFVSQLPHDKTKHIDQEHFLNHFDPFFICAWMYFGVIVLAAFSWLGWGRRLNNAATVLAFVTVAVHTFGLVMRIIISEKPPVTNLYSSAVFIGWGCVLLGIGMDLYFRNGICNFIAGKAGMATLFVAMFLEASGDTMPRVEAVLNTSFWLWTHVTIVTLGYTATYIAALIGLIYVLGAMFTNVFRGELSRTVYAMMYGVTCFATLLSFVGTVLGGFWADDSWGRFWGWDPKENGAVIIVIWNTLILHMRWAGLVKARGFALMTLLGIAITTWSWFGTNQLGLGLHAYGFDKSLATGCAICWIAVVLTACLGLVPSQYWASLGPEPAAALPRVKKDRKKA